ncbi:hypothetical protein OUZ56_018350 [Daphnia magna]|uniref:Uncharacterized protein n=1 Tax=Daphnia magna TaxID=35525 RepID=A0ABQ9Z977_9CRUS|nr:hypothetical protein OUZ56_018350 [Daphnia magna]
MLLYTPSAAEIYPSAPGGTSTNHNFLFTSKVEHVALQRRIYNDSSMLSSSMFKATKWARGKNPQPVLEISSITTVTD